MEAEDKKQLYEVNEMEELQTEDVQYKDAEPVFGLTTARQHLSRVITPIFGILVVLLLVILLILQSATLYQIKANPEAASSTTTTSGALTGGGDTTTCDCRNDMEMLQKILNRSQDIVSFNDMLSVYIMNSTENLEDNLVTTEKSAQLLSEIIRTLSNLKDNSITTEVTVNDVLLVAQALLNLQNTSQSFELKSCQELQPNSPSGYYHINSQLVYCEMGELCNSTGGWTRLAYLDMSDSTVDCPTGFTLVEGGGVRACGRPGNVGSCESIKFPSNGISYSQVCGRVVGYQYGSTDGVDTRFIPLTVHNDIDNYYVDGVSITTGYPRQHIWTLMSGVSSSIFDAGNCICNTPPGSTQDVQSFIGDNYFCESGNPNYWSYTFYPNDPLWDGDGCGSQEGNCCSVPGLPWFYRTIDTTTDYLEVRLCGDQGPQDEDVPIGLYEIYVK